MSRSDALLARCDDDLAAASACPLLGSMADGGVEPAVFARYLELEAGFVRTAAELVERAFEEESDAAVRERLQMIHDDLTGPQHRYFAEGGVARDAESVLSTFTRSLAAAHHVPAIVVCFAAAETLYLRWASAASVRGLPREPALQRWIDMHATPEFAAQAVFWQSLIDRIPETVVSDRMLDDWFRGMLAAENAFHDSAYQEEPA
jgi:thiaminase/transcriptional activator TenA